MENKILKIEGMTCAACAKDVEVNLDNKLVTAEVSEKITDEAIIEAIEEAGYDVLGIEKS